MNRYNRPSSADIGKVVVDEMYLRPGQVTEYRVTNMTGRPTVSGIYSTARLGRDALQLARNAQRSRGGSIEARTIVTSDWKRL